MSSPPPTSLPHTLQKILCGIVAAISLVLLLPYFGITPTGTAPQTEEEISAERAPHSADQGDSRTDRDEANRPAHPTPRTPRGATLSDIEELLER